MSSSWKQAENTAALSHEKRVRAHRCNQIWIMQLQLQGLINGMWIISLVKKGKKNGSFLFPIILRVTWWLKETQGWDEIGNRRALARSGALLRGKRTTVQSGRNLHCIRIKLLENKSWGWHRAKADMNIWSLLKVYSEGQDGWRTQDQTSGRTWARRLLVAQWAF